MAEPSIRTSVCQTNCLRNPTGQLFLHDTYFVRRQLKMPDVLTCRLCIEPTSAPHQTLGWGTPPIPFLFSQSLVQWQVDAQFFKIGLWALGFRQVMMKMIIDDDR
jgi:hypothetical protein